MSTYGDLPMGQGFSAVARQETMWSAGYNSQGHSQSRPRGKRTVGWTVKFHDRYLGDFRTERAARATEATLNRMHELTGKEEVHLWGIDRYL